MQPVFSAAKHKNQKVEKKVVAEKKAEVEKPVDPAALKKYEAQCSLINPLDLVSDPPKYLNQFVKIEGTFDRYTTLGLDYKPAFRDSKDYITFLIRRPEVKQKKNIIPLSELKMIIARKTAEKYTNLESGDNVVIFGKVFSSALNDPWVDVDHIFSKTKDITIAGKKEPEGDDN